jgi:pheromone shutdown protein TraB
MSSVVGWLILGLLGYTLFDILRTTQKARMVFERLSELADEEGDQDFSEMHATDMSEQDAVLAFIEEFRRIRGQQDDPDS